MPSRPSRAGVEEIIRSSIGSANAIVFPEPVRDRTTQSCPPRICSIVAACTGNRLSMPHRRRERWVSALIPNESKLPTGAAAGAAAGTAARARSGAAVLL